MSESLYVVVAVALSAAALLVSLTLLAAMTLGHVHGHHGHHGQHGHPADGGEPYWCPYCQTWH